MENISKSRLFFYNLSNAGQALVDTIIVFFLAIFFLPPKELVDQGMIQYLNPKVFFGGITVLGIITLFGRIIDSVADPLIASLSDNNRSSFGRRRIFMLISALPLAASAVLIYFPPVPGTSSLNAVYVACMLGVYFFFYTMYVAPYIALIPELGHTESKRINIATVQGYMALLGAAIVMIGGPVLINLLGRADNPVSGYQRAMPILGVIAFLLLLSSIISVDEKRYTKAQNTAVPFWKSLKMTLTNKRFLIFLCANMLFWFIFNLTRQSIIHITLVLIGGDKNDASFNSTIMFVSSGIFFLVVSALSKKIGKKIIYAAGILSFGILNLLIVFIGIVPIPAEILGIILFILLGFPVSVFLLVPNVFISEICEKDSKDTGLRREAMFFGVHGLFSKLVLGISAAVQAGFYLGLGKDLSNPLGVRLAPLAGTAAAVIGFVFILFYPVLKKEEPSQ